VATTGTRFLQPVQKLTYQAGRRAAIAIATRARQTLFNLIDPQHARRYVIGSGEGFLQAAFALPQVLSMDGGQIQAVQGQLPVMRNGLGRQGFAAARHPHQQHAAWWPNTALTQIRRKQRSLALQPGLEPAQTTNGHLRTTHRDPLNAADIGENPILG